MPKVSVIIPTFNRAAFLEKAIKSIISQNFNSFEIIVSDNASTDNTEDLVKSFGSERIIYHKNEQNIGIVGNHNKALELATGEYIHIFSDDDLMNQDSILKKALILDTHKNIGLVHSDIVMINGDDNIISPHWASSYYKDWGKYHNESRMFIGKEYFKILYYHWNIISMPSVMVRGSIIRENNLQFDSRLKLTIDLEMWMKFCLYGDVYYINEILVQYRAHASNTILEESKSSTYNEFAMIKRILFEKFASSLADMSISESEIDTVVANQINTYPLLRSEEHVHKSLLRALKDRIYRLIHSV
jgi:glycosyltransferase involved in cell wall biosynthesis